MNNFLICLMAPEPWQIMATHKIAYNNEEGFVEVIQTTNGRPEFFFFVHFPSREILLSRFPALKEKPGEFWNGTSLSLQEAEKLAHAILQQIGYTLPARPPDNPFEYNSDEITIRIEKFIVDRVSIERAKAPFTNDVYYRITFSPRRSFIFVRMLFMNEWSWFPHDTNIDRKSFKIFTSMLQHFEEAYQLGIYEPVI